MVESQHGGSAMSALTMDRMNRYTAGMCYGIGLLSCTQLAFLAFLTMLFRIHGTLYLIPIFAASIILMLILVADIYFTSRYLTVRRIYISRALLMFNYAHVLFALLFLLKDF